MQKNGPSPKTLIIYFILSYITDNFLKVQNTLRKMEKDVDT